MTNLLTVLPDFDLKPFSHILPSLERALVSAADLLTLDAVDVAKRAQVPPGEVRKLNDALLNGLHSSTNAPDENTAVASFTDGQDLIAQWQTISTLDAHLDATLGGGIATGHLTEFVGESAAGKTQSLLTLLLSVQLLPGQNSALYISTGSPLQTTRLSQILTTHPALAALGPQDKPSLSRIHSTHIHDLEAQEHILHYQVPIIVARHNVGLIVIDSIAANFRPEFNNEPKGTNRRAGAESFAQRAIQLQHLGRLLHDLARKHNLAVVVANQVSDRFINPASAFPLAPSSQQYVYALQQQQQQASPRTPSGVSSQRPPHPPSQSQFQQPADDTLPAPPLTLSTDDPLSLDHQQNFFSGWGDTLPISLAIQNNPDFNANLKTPSLGLVWTNQLDARFALLKDSQPDDREKWVRKVKVVFCPWAREGEAEFELWGGGVRAVGGDEGGGEEDGGA